MLSRWYFALLPHATPLAVYSVGVRTTPVRVRFLVVKVALGQVFLLVLRLYPVSITPPMLHTRLHLHVGFTSSTNGRNLGIFQEAMLFRTSASLG